MSNNTNTAYAATASASISGTSNVSMSVTPGSSGTTVVGSTRINYSVSNAISYRLTLSSNSTRTTLASTNTSVSTESIPTLSSNSTLNNLSSTAWGFCINTGTTACNANNTFRAARSSSSVYTIASGTLSSSTSSSSNYATSGTRTLTYGAKIYPSLAAGTYSNTQIISLTAEDRPDDLETISTMQEMTSAICAATRTPSASETTTVPTKQLIDTRDNKTYWVAKLADGNCWMTQNLALDLSKSTTLTPDDTDIASNWTPTQSTKTSHNRQDSTSTTAIMSWKYFANRVVINPGQSSSLCGNTETISACTNLSRTVNTTSAWTDDFVATGTGSTQDEINASLTTVDSTNQKFDAHYLTGNMYTWNAATAATGGSMSSGSASGSICPKGWHLPDGNSTSSGSFANLFNSYNLPYDTTSATTSESGRAGTAPLYFGPVAGLWIAGSGVGWVISWRTYYGGSWYTRTVSNASTVYGLIIGSTRITANTTRGKAMGISVRCVAY